VIPKGLPRREEPSAVITKPIAHLAVFGDFVAEAVVLAREGLGAPERAWEGRARFGPVRVHVHFESVLAGEAAGAPGSEACEPPFRGVLLVACGAAESGAIER